MTTYAGTYDAQSLSSLYPNVYRVQYDAMIGSRQLNVDKIVTAIDEDHARERVHRSSGSTVYGAITVEHVATLDAVDS